MGGSGGGFSPGSPPKLKAGGTGIDFPTYPKMPQPERQAKEAFRYYSQYAPGYVGINEQIAQKYIPETVRTYNTLGKQVADDLGLRTQLDPDLERQVTQYIRGGQAARGNVYGNAPVSAEALYKGAAGQQLYQQRLQNATGFMSTPTAIGKVGEMLGPVATNVLSNALTQTWSPFSYLQQGIANQTQDFMNRLNEYQTYNTLNLQRYQMGTAAQAAAAQAGGGANPWLQGIGTVVGAAAGALAMCWVARECFGTERIQTDHYQSLLKWQVFRSWLLSKAPKWLMNLYMNKGERFAKWLSKHTVVKKIIKFIMEHIIRRYLNAKKV